MYPARYFKEKYVNVVNKCANCAMIFLRAVPEEWRLTVRLFQCDKKVYSSSLYPWFVTAHLPLFIKSLMEATKGLLIWQGVPTSFGCVKKQSSEAFSNEPNSWCFKWLKKRYCPLLIGPPCNLYVQLVDDRKRLRSCVEKHVRMHVNKLNQQTLILSHVISVVLKIVRGGKSKKKLSLFSMHTWRHWRTTQYTQPKSLLNSFEA